MPIACSHRPTHEEQGLACILGVLDQAVTDAERRCLPYGHEFSKIAKHSRIMCVIRIDRFN